MGLIEGEIESMRGIGFVFAIGFILISSAFGVDLSSEPMIVQWYHHHYPFTIMMDSIYTFQSEFDMPDGFDRPDSSQLTDFQNWVANFPLLHQWQSVHTWKGFQKYKAEEISRGVHLPYRSQDFKDCAVPIAILAEYLHYYDRESELSVIPKKGDTLQYKAWLRGQLRYAAFGRVLIEPDEERDVSASEYNKFVHACLYNTSYKSLAQNCDSIDVRELMPGDLFIAHDKLSRAGCVYIVMHMLNNKKGEKLYAVACGCSESCDFHIPLLTGDRDNPWITTDHIQSLAENMPYSGFFRFRIH